MAEEDRLSAAQLEAELAARRIWELLRENTQVADGDGLRPLRPGDIVILLRSPAGRAESYQRALQRRGIPCAIEQKGDPWNVTERAVILALLSVIDNPRQDVMLVAALRSPLFALSADELSELRVNCPEGDYFDAVVQAAQAGDGRCRAFLDFLEEFRLLAPDLSVEALLRRIYERTDLLALAY